jgi:hypothetical protein
VDLLNLFLAPLVVLPAAAFACWTWFAMRQIEEDLLEFEGHKDIAFEI